jgi:3-methyladenine DNA glycosylase AlkC
MAETKPFKLWFDAALVRATAARLHEVEPRFDRAGFVKRASKGLDALEMMGRVGHLADALHAALPRPTKVALAALVASMPEPADGSDGITGHGYALWPYGEYIARYGHDDVDASFDAMIELTQRFSSEFAVRPFLAADPDGMLDRLEALVTHPSVHVRRWVSEGTRTRLPWGKRVPGLETRAPRRLAILAKLRHDPDRYVQRSVANHLQDALKDDRALALPVLRAWLAEGVESSTWIARHAARGLLKAGDPEVLALFGHHEVAIEVLRATVSPKRVAIGDEVVLTIRLRNAEGAPVHARVDYELTSPGARERPTKKVFRFADVELAPDEEAERTTKHAFVHRTIRTIRPGEHRFELRVNGRVGAELVVTVRE